MLIKLELGVWIYLLGSYKLNFVVLNSLIGIYAKCEIIHKILELLYKMHDANIISWYTIIVEYV